MCVANNGNRENHVKIRELFFLYIYISVVTLKKYLKNLSPELKAQDNF